MILFLPQAFPDFVGKNMVRDMVNIGSFLLLLEYMHYFASFSLNKHFLYNSKRITIPIFIHNIFGLLLSIIGSCLWIFISFKIYLVNSNYNDNFNYLCNNNSYFILMFNIFCILCIINMFGGFLLIPRLPSNHPSSKRIFMSSLSIQISTLFVFRLFIFSNDKIFQKIDIYLLIVCCCFGFFVTCLNILAHFSDYFQNKSNHQNKSNQNKSYKEINLFDEYIFLLFYRGYHKTRRPSNKRMIFISSQLFIAYIFFFRIITNINKIIADNFIDDNLRILCLFSSILLLTIGNLQIFHCTMAIRGKCNVHSARNYIVVTLFTRFMFILISAIKLDLLNQIKKLLFIEGFAIRPGAVN